MMALPWRVLRIGDGLVILLGALFSVWLAQTVWQGGKAHKAIIRAGGAIISEADLNTPRRIVVPGPLGNSVVEIAQGRARVASDPSPRQLCVKQGWLSQAGDAAICLPNQLSVELAGSRRRYDSLNY